MSYREYPPHPALAAHVACLWTAHTAGGAAAQQVLPDNCIDLLWQDDGQPGYAVGMMSRSILVASSIPQRTLAVRFKPGAASRFLAAPLALLTDQRVDLDVLWGRSEAEQLTETLWSGNYGERARLAKLEQYLLRRLQAAPSADSGTLLVGRALAVLTADEGVRIATLAAQLEVSRQHLATLFRTRVGLSPKLYARIQRFRRASAALHTGAGPDWAQLALDCGYFDQAHLIHDFQEFAGSTPQRWLIE